MEQLLQLESGGSTWLTSLLSITLAWVLTTAIAWVYARTHRGLSYSRSMTHALVVAGIVAAMLMLAIGNSLARGIGIVGTLALIRFRINLRDPMDMLFVFAAFAAGIAAGTGSHATAVVGTVFFLAVTVLLRVTDFGAHNKYDGVLRLQAPSAGSAELDAVLKRLCKSAQAIQLSEVQQGERHALTYHIVLRDQGDKDKLLAAVGAVEGVTDAVVAMQESTIEV